MRMTQFLPTGPHEYIHRKVAEQTAALRQYEDKDGWTYHVVGPKRGPYRIEVRDQHGKVQGFY